MPPTKSMKRVAVDVVHERALGAFHDDIGRLAQAVRHGAARRASSARLRGPGTSVFR